MASTADALRRALKGALLVPGEAGYNAARTVWNGMIDRRPAAIARCACVEDVVASLRWARESGLSVSVRAGGHSVAGRSVPEGGLMIDLSPMQGIDVNARARVARLGPGVRLGALDAATQRHGLATTAGVHSRTGVAGLTLGGGQGWLMRKHGLTIDNLLSAQVVTAAGEVVTASADSEPDLFWALRGGGGGLGVVTRFDFRLHPIGSEVLVGQLFLPIERAKEALRLYREFAAGAPDELSCYALLLTVQPGAALPSDLHGRRVVALAASFAGDLEAGRAALAPLARARAPLFHALAPMSYTTLQTAFDAGNPDHARYYWKSHYLRALADGAIEELARAGAALPSALSTLFLEPLGGAVGRVPVDATAYPHRDAAFCLGVNGGWRDPAQDEAVMAWARRSFEALAPFSTGGMYANYLDFDDRDREPAAFGPNVARLRAVKAKYDPGGLFRGA